VPGVTGVTWWVPLLVPLLAACDRLLLVLLRGQKRTQAACAAATHAVAVFLPSHLLVHVWHLHVMS
jgi:hypothetical protein